MKLDEKKLSEYFLVHEMMNWKYKEKIAALYGCSPSEVTIKKEDGGTCCCRIDFSVKTFDNSFDGVVVFGFEEFYE